MAKGKGHNRGPTQVHGMKGRVRMDQPAHTSEPESRQYEGATSARRLLYGKTELLCDSVPTLPILMPRFQTVTKRAECEPTAELTIAWRTEGGWVIEQISHETAEWVRFATRLKRESPEPQPESELLCIQVYYVSCQLHSGTASHHHHPSCPGESPRGDQGAMKGQTHSVRGDCPDHLLPLHPSPSLPKHLP